MPGIKFHPEIFMRAKSFGRIAAGFFIFGLAFNAPANPAGMTVASGSASAAQSGSQLTITASQNAFLNWQSFNIAAGETTVFNQPSAQSIVWNSIGGNRASQIFGSLQANGVVVLMNSSGFYFGPNSFVQAAGLIVSTAQTMPQNTGGAWEFNGPPPAASIVNYGKINVVNGGPAFLIAENVANFGEISAPGGTIGIAAGQDVLVSERPDGRGLSMKVTLPAGAVDNEGRLAADAGTISVNAQVVNQNGIVQANSVRDENGVIELVASDKLNLGANSKILANGDGSAGGSSGGSVTLQSGNTFSDATGSQIDVKGGSQGGNGGNVEISAPEVLSLKSGIDAGAQPGWTAGKLLLDPYDIILDTSGGDSAGSGTVLAGDDPGGTLDLNVNTAFANLTVSEILLEATHDITLTGGTQWNLSGTIGVTSGQLTLEAGNNIIFQDGSSIVDANNWSVSLFAGVDFTSPTLKVVPVPAGNTDPDITHSIYLNGGDGLSDGGSIQTAGGSISLTAGQDIETGGGSLQDANYNNFAIASASGSVSLTAGQDIQIGSGYVETTGGGNISLTAGQDIQVGSGYVETTAGGTINLTAVQDIDIGSGSVSATGGGNVNAIATSGSLNDSGSIRADTGSITVLAGQDVLLNSSVASIVTTGGWGTDSDGNPISISGGNISVTAVAGSVNTGSNPNGYKFNATPWVSPIPYAVDVSRLGGISTAAGGNVNITAGLDIISFLPKGSTTAGDAGSGAFGTGMAGDVTLTAGRNIEGHYVVADGTGTINAGVNIPQYLLNRQIILSNPNGNAGTTSTDTGFTSGDAEPATMACELALSLIDGGWTVNAAHDINLQEVRNPNGILNSGNKYSTYFHLFDYGLDDYVSLNAGNGVHIWGDNLPRSDSVGAIYPSILNITAGAGGVEIGGEVILFPSPDGSLEISTTGGGALTGDLSSTVPDIIMSDADLNIPRGWQYTSLASFGAGDHAATPVHYGSPTPVALNISGDMDNFYLVVPEAAQINVVGDMNNCSFEGQNLSSDPNQTVQVQVREADGSLGMAAVYPGMTSINVGQTAKANMENSGLLNPATDSGLYVGGNILNQNQYNSVTLSSPPDLSLLLQSSGPSFSDLFDNLFYDPVSGKLTFKGVLTSDEASALESLQIQEVVNGVPQYAADGVTPILEYVYPLDPRLVTPITSASTPPQTPQAIITLVNQLQSESQNAPPNPNPGYILGGGGTFDITAHTLDLGSTLGIQTIGPASDPALVQYYISTISGHIAHGADINVNLSGDLDMFATTISTLNGGNISVNAAGDVNVGSTYVSGNDDYARGIYTTGEGSVSVIAGGNIEVAGSRIAAYDGGNVTVESLYGNVDAGNGGSGSVTVDEYYVDPLTGTTEFSNPTIPLSGILAMTFPPRDSSSTEPEYSAGNVLVETPQGNITATSAGVVQLGLNNQDSSSATVELLAGYELQDAQGNSVSADDLSDGTPVMISASRNIDTSGSGVIAENAVLKTTGEIKGLIFSKNSTTLDAGLIGPIIVLSKDITANGPSTGPVLLIGTDKVTASGVSPSDILSKDANGSGSTFAQGTAANTASAGLANDQTTKPADSSDDTTDDEKKKGKKVTLAQKVGRVTVILPPKKVSAMQTATPGI
jgi:filamentous hemagglutinin family protein